MSKADNTINDTTLKEIRDSIKLENMGSDSRQPKVGIQKSEKLLQSNLNGRRYITSGCQSNNTITKKSTAG